MLLSHKTDIWRNRKFLFWPSPQETKSPPSQFPFRLITVAWCKHSIMWTWGYLYLNLKYFINIDYETELFLSPRSLLFIDFVNAFSKVCWRPLPGLTSLHDFCCPSQDGEALVLLLTGQKWVNVIMWPLHWKNLSPVQQQGNVLMTNPWGTLPLFSNSVSSLCTHISLFSLNQSLNTSADILRSVTVKSRHIDKLTRTCMQVIFNHVWREVGIIIH